MTEKRPFVVTGEPDLGVIEYYVVFARGKGEAEHLLKKANSNLIYVSACPARSLTNDVINVAFVRRGGQIE